MSSEGGVDPAMAFDRALRYLGHRARSVYEVRTRLLRYGYDEATIDGVLTRLIELGYLDDSTFALILARDYLGSPRPRGERAIMAQLRSKGVDEGVARVALAQALEEADESPAERVHRAAERWSRRLRPGEDPARARRRLWGYLSRAGFDGDLIREAIERLLP